MPVLLDLFCGVGGAAKGYHDAGFDTIIGIDTEPQPRYPYRFIRANALAFPDLIDRFGLPRPDAIHASPPCQAYSGHVKNRDRPRLIEPIRSIINSYSAIGPITNSPGSDNSPGSGANPLFYVIENVIGAKDELTNPVLLCGSMFGMPIKRHRLFECNFPIPTNHIPRHNGCYGASVEYADAMGIDPTDMYVVGRGRRSGSRQIRAQLLEIPWAKTANEISEAIPPAFTRFIGREIIANLSS